MDLYIEESVNMKTVIEVKEFKPVGGTVLDAILNDLYDYAIENECIVKFNFNEVPFKIYFNKFISKEEQIQDQIEYYHEYDNEDESAYGIIEKHG